MELSYSKKHKAKLGFPYSQTTFLGLYGKKAWLNFANFVSLAWPKRRETSGNGAKSMSRQTDGGPSNSKNMQSEEIHWPVKNRTLCWPPRAALPTGCLFSPLSPFFLSAAAGDIQVTLQRKSVAGTRLQAQLMSYHIEAASTTSFTK